MFLGGQFWNITHSPYKWYSFSLNGLVTSSRNRNWEVMSPSKISTHLFRSQVSQVNWPLHSSEICINFSFEFHLVFYPQLLSAPQTWIHLSSILFNTFKCESSSKIFFWKILSVQNKKWYQFCSVSLNWKHHQLFSFI